ncbi:protein MIZU-KUSSEI 1-like [Juglans microcarpa x Juglans regia]|uniref:protein MIZU-KUSSEI 1-like n=1 Tax=Juglans microcarpa x Juglans regia TaxID=2249226 RepID=UPI001B7E0C2B|nr:protein MIZU-KUSSEI 1-like [Juglans microcarpa x Juglans regia]
MRMIDLGSQRGHALHIMDTATSVDCGKDVRLRRSFRSLVECMVPCCGFQPSDSLSSDTESTLGSSSTVTGTFFGYRKGRVSFCLQDDTRSSPLLLLEFAVPTAYLAREMQHGVLRIALECDRQKETLRSSSTMSSNSSSCSLFNVPVWSMYCNGRKVGFAIRRQMTASDAAVLKQMQTVSVGAGVLPAAAANKSEVEGDGGDQLLYLRAGFERVIGSHDSESFHMINPVGSSGQELSIFLLRS